MDGKELVVCFSWMPCPNVPTSLLQTTALRPTPPMWCASYLPAAQCGPRSLRSRTGHGIAEARLENPQVSCCLMPFFATIAFYGILWLCDDHCSTFLMALGNTSARHIGTGAVEAVITIAIMAIARIMYCYCCCSIIIGTKH